MYKINKLNCKGCLLNVVQSHVSGWRRRSGWPRPAEPGAGRRAAPGSCTTRRRGRRPPGSRAPPLEGRCQEAPLSSLLLLHQDEVQKTSRHCFEHFLSSATKGWTWRWNISSLPLEGSLSNTGNKKCSFMMLWSSVGSWDLFISFLKSPLYS